MALNGSVMYFVPFIYDSPRKLWVYFQKNKNNVLATFRTWKAMVEEQIGLHIKCLCSNSSGEYNNNEFKSLYTKNGIVMKKTIS